MIGIYKITSPSKKVYIGQSINIEKRFNYYKLLNSKKQPVIYRSFLKYGVDKHKFEVICECDISELNEKERYYQDIFSATGKNGLNCVLTKASDRSGKFSEETCKKLKDSWKMRKPISEEHKRKISEKLKGRIFSDETKLKMREWQIGKVLSEEHKKKLSITSQINGYRKKIILNTETGIFYLGNKEAAKTININPYTLRGNLNGTVRNKTSFIYV